MDQFDYLLFELSEQSAVKAPKVVNKIRPWKKMFDLIKWALWMQLFQFWGLFGETIGWFGMYIQPILVCVLFIKAFFIGYSENRYFKIAYWISWGYLLHHSICTIGAALPVWNTLPDYVSGLQRCVTPVVNWLLLYNLSKALERVIQEKESVVEIRNVLKELRFLVIVVALLLGIGIHSPYNQTLVNTLFIILGIIYIIEVKYISRLCKTMEEHSYSIRVNRKRRTLLNHVAIILELSATLILTLWCVEHSYHIQEPVTVLDMEQEQQNYDLKKLAQIKEKLIAFGMKPYIANDLLPEDLIRFENVKGLLKSERVYDFSYAGAKFKLTVYAGEVFYYYEEDRNINGDIFVDEVLYYFEWLEEPKEYYGEVLTLPQDKVSSVGRNQWIHIAELENQTVYYDSNITELQTIQIMFGHSKQQYQFFSTSLPNAKNYRSYIVRQMCDEYYPSGHEIELSFIKKQKVYPFISLLEFNHKYPYYWKYLNIEPMYEAALDAPDEFVHQMYGLPNYMENRLRLRFKIERNAEERVEDVPMIYKEDVYDDFTEGREYQSALYIFSYLD